MNGASGSSPHPGSQSVFPSMITPYAAKLGSSSDRHYVNPSGPESVVLQWVLSLMGPGGDEDGAKRWSSFIGIIVAISGNILISLALNVQKYAHIRLRREKSQRKRSLREQRGQAWKRALAGIGTAGQPGSRDSGIQDQVGVDEIGQLDGDESPEDEDPDHTNEPSTLPEAGKPHQSNQMYLYSPWWWLGLILMTVGEFGNFLAYGFAPASIVSPLGVVALISNCIIAPLMLKEPFRGRDFLGIVVSIAGAVVVVLSSAPEEVKLGPDQILEAISQTAFEVYFGVTCLLIGALMCISQKYGSKFIIIDLGLVALFGGYTVLSTKGISSLLSTSLYHIFTMPIAYLFAGVLISTAVMQIKYVNRALQRFDSTQVIPTQFVLFTLSVIIGSGILYRDFEKISQDRLSKFVFGCGFTFWGVYLITSGRVTKGEEDDERIAEEGYIGLVEGEGHSGNPSQHNSIGRQRGLSIFGAGGAASSRATRSARNSYQSAHVALAFADTQDVLDSATETSPLLGHHSDYNDGCSSPSDDTLIRQSFPHNVATSNTPQRHPISLIPGPIVLGYQLQAVVADHVGPPAAFDYSKRIIRRVKSRTVDVTLPARTAPGSLLGRGEGSSHSASNKSFVPRTLQEPEDASSDGDSITASGTQNGARKSSSGRGRSSSLHLAMDYVKVSSTRKRNGSVDDGGAGARERERER